MIFDKSKVYTTVNADELERGDLIIGADSLALLKEKVGIGSEKDLFPLIEVRGEDTDYRFDTEEDYFSLAYLVCTARNVKAFKAWHKSKKIEMEYAEPDDREKSVWRLFENEEPDWCNYHYRPAKEYRPFASIDELITEFKKRFKTNVPFYALPLIWVKSRDKDESHLITGFSEACAKIDGIHYGLEALLECFTFLDGSPCGVEQ